MSDISLLTILRVLSKHNVDFIVVGAMSAVIQGLPLNTADLDIVQSRTPENLQRLEAALAEIGATYRFKSDLRPTASQMTGTGHHLLRTRHGPLDVLGEIQTGQFPDLLPQSITIEVEPGFQIRVLSVDALIIEKERVGREKDRIAVALLRRLKGL